MVTQGPLNPIENYMFSYLWKKKFIKVRAKWGNFIKNLYEQFKTLYKYILKTNFEVITT